MAKSVKSGDRDNLSTVGLFPNHTSAIQALTNIERLGIGREQISVTSSIPYPDGTFRTDVRPSRLPFISAFGAVGGISLGLALAVGTALAYQLPTGGMPIVAVPTVAVITYEMMMLGIILLTFVGALFEMNLPRLRRPPYDPRISDGYIGVSVPAESEQRAAEIEKILAESGAVEVKRFAGG